MKKILLLILLFLGVGFSLSVSAYTTVSGGITTDTTWTTGTTYYVTSTITISQGATLTIQPGTIVKFGSSGGIDADGNLVVNGTLGQKVHFTSENDNTVGEIIAASTGTPLVGSWQGFQFDNYDFSKDSVLDHVVIKYATRGIYLYRGNGIEIKNSLISNISSHGIDIRGYSTSYPIFTIENTTVSNVGGIVGGIEIDKGTGILTNVTSENNTGVGLRTSGGDISISNSSFKNNLVAGIDKASGTGNMTITGSHFENNVKGLDVGSIGSVNITGSSFSGNTLHGVLTTNGDITFSGNTLNNNTGDYVVESHSWDMLRGLNTYTNNQYNGYHLTDNEQGIADITIEKAGVDIYLSSTLDIIQGNTVRIQAGNIFKFDANAGFDVEGTFIVNGNESEKVVFTSENDNSYGHTMPLSTGTPSAGSWLGFQFNNYDFSKDSILDHVVIKYATRGVYVYTGNGLEVKNSLISDMGAYGIRVRGYSTSHPVYIIENTTVSNVGGLAGGIEINKGTGILTNVTSENNTGVGLRTSGGDISISNSNFRNNLVAGIDKASGTGSMTIIGSDFENNLKGLDIGTLGSVNITGSSFSGNTLHGILTTNGDITFSGNTLNNNTGDYVVKSHSWDMLRGLNTYTNNQYNGYYLTDNDQSITDITIKNSGVDIYLSATLDILQGNTVRIEAGNIFKFNISGGFDVEGTFIVNGSESEKVVFTSMNDNSYGHNMLVSTGTPSAGSWQGFQFNNYDFSKDSILNHVVVKYATRGIYMYTGNGIEIKNSLISDMGSYGIWIRGYSASFPIYTIENTTVSNVGGAAGAIRIQDGSGTIRNTIVANSTTGIYMTGGTPTITYNLFHNLTNNTYPTNYSLDSSNITGQDPLFLDTNSYLIPDNSPAVDAGDPAMGNHPVSGTPYDIGYHEAHGFVYQTITAHITDFGARDIDYVWSFTQEPTGGSEIPVLQNVSGNLISQQLTTRFLLKRLGNYTLELVLTEDGVEIGRESVNIVVNN